MPFSYETRSKLAHEVGLKCSSPDCRVTTSAPHRDPSIKNGGDAAHIISENNKDLRHVPGTPNSILNDQENGIWLCPNCHRKIDRFQENYPSQLLHQWKEKAIRSHNGSILKPAFDPSSLTTIPNELERADKFLDKIRPLIQEVSNLRFNTHPYQRTTNITTQLDIETSYVARRFLLEGWTRMSPYWCFSEILHDKQEEILRLAENLQRFIIERKKLPNPQINHNHEINEDGDIIYPDPIKSTMVCIHETYNELINMVHGRDY